MRYSKGFALAAGLSGAIDLTSISVTAGLAEIAAGSIAMGLGGSTVGKRDAEHYFGERAREAPEIPDKADIEGAESLKCLNPMVCCFLRAAQCFNVRRILPRRSKRRPSPRPLNRRLRQVQPYRRNCHKPG
jgi:hypothetical protein